MNDSGGVGSIGCDSTRTTRKDVFMSSTAGSTAGATTAATTPRSTSWTRTSRATTAMHTSDSPSAMGRLDHTKRSVSVCCPKKKAAEKKEEEQREMARQAFEAWLSRKSAEPRRSRASPSREEIAKHLRDDAKHRVYNTWYYKMFDMKLPMPERNMMASTKEA